MEHSSVARIQGRVLNSASFIAQFAISMANLALVYHLRIRFSLSAQMIGLSAAIYTSTYLLCCVALGPIAAHMRPRHSVELSMVGMALSIGVVMTTHSVAVAMLALMAYGLFMSFLWPQIESWIARGKEGRELNRATSAFNVSWSVGYALSPQLTGLLVERSTSAPLLAAVVLFVVVLLLIIFSTLLVPGIKAVVSERKNIESSQGEDQSTPLRFLSWAGVLAVYASLAVLLTIFPLHAMEHLPFSESATGFLLLVRGVATVGMFILLGKTSWWHFNRPLIITTLAIVSATCLLGSRIQSFGMHVLFFFLFGVLFALAYSFSIFHGASGSIHRSRRMLIHEILLTVGTVLGSVMGGSIYERLDYHTVLYACAALVLVPALAALVHPRSSL
jgi:DHA1 family multidrug resistance protein-like MFS transporter/DHA1 family quinolone resistance protein-like MFS transporter